MQLDPDFADARNNLGLVLHNQAKFDEAMGCFRRALEINPTYGSAHLNQAIGYLLHGDFVHGWSEYEWRWRAEDVVPREFSEPLWDGHSLEGKTILLYAEQGLGDTMQFVRYVPWVKQRGAHGGSRVSRGAAPLADRLCGRRSRGQQRQPHCRRSMCRHRC